MATARQIAKQLLKTYTAVYLVEQDHQKYKIEGLLESRPKYKLLDLEHPYYNMAKQANKARKDVEATVRLLIDARVGTSTVRDELLAIKQKDAANGVQNQYLDHLLEL